MAKPMAAPPGPDESGDVPAASRPEGTEIRIIDTTLRDAHQCLWATRMRTAHMLPSPRLRPRRLRVDRPDGTIQFDVCVRFLKEDPWERVRRVHQGAPHTQFRSLIRSKNLVSFDFLPDDIIELWVDRLHRERLPSHRRRSTA